MDQEIKPKSPPSLIDKIIKYFIASFCLLMGVVGLFSLIDSPAERASIFPYFLFFVFTPLGLSIFAPNLIGAKIKIGLSKVFLPIGFIAKKFEIGKKFQWFFENRIGNGILFLAFAGLEFWGLFHIDDGRWWICLLGVIMFAAMGLYSLFPQLMIMLGVLLLSLTLLAIILGLIFAAYKAFGATPVAIVIGAMIVASAIKNKS